MCTCFLDLDKYSSCSCLYFRISKKGKRAGMFNPQTFHQAEVGRDSGQEGYHQVPLVDPNEILFEASAYLYWFYQEHGMLKAYPERLNRVRAEIERTGTYRHTYEEP